MRRLGAIAIALGIASILVVLLVALSGPVRVPPEQMAKDWEQMQKLAQEHPYVGK